MRACVRVRCVCVYVSNWFHFFPLPAMVMLSTEWTTQVSTKLQAIKLWPYTHSDTSKEASPKSGYKQKHTNIHYTGFKNHSKSSRQLRAKAKRILGSYFWIHFIYFLIHFFFSLASMQIAKYLQSDLMRQKRIRWRLGKKKKYVMLQNMN